MPRRDLNKRLASLEHMAIDLAISKALAAARAVSKDKFAATLLDVCFVNPTPVYFSVGKV